MLRRFALFLSLLAGCASEPTPVVWNCSCTAVCDGNTVSGQEQICNGDPDEVAQMVSDETDACLNALTEGGCTEGSCSCECEPTEQACE